MLYELEKNHKYSFMSVRATYDLGVKSEITSLTVDPAFTQLAVGTVQVNSLSRRGVVWSGLRGFKGGTRQVIGQRGDSVG